MRAHCRTASLPAIIAFLLLMSVSTVSQALPSRGFYQELALVSEAGRVSIDVYNSTGKYSRMAYSQIRVGLPWQSEAWLGENGLGYKKMLSRFLAVYGQARISLSNGQDSQVSCPILTLNAHAIFF